MLFATDKIINDLKYRKGNLLTVFLDPLEIYKYTFILQFHGYAKKALKSIKAMRKKCACSVHKGVRMQSADSLKKPQRRDRHDRLNEWKNICGHRSSH